MSNFRFSIAIPTREKPKTLHYALRTCLAQRFESYEVIVCDDCTTPETKETVESFDSEKIKYVRSDRPLTQSQNWELAVSQAEGEFVILIGDDDGLLLNALGRIDQLLKILRVKALCWDWIWYNWPDSLGQKNLLRIPLVRENSILQFSRIISKIANSKLDLLNMPMLYNAAIHRDLIDLLKEETGRVFGGICPDLYSGFAFGHLARSYAHVGLPMSVYGQSATSGNNACFLSKDMTIAKDFKMPSSKVAIEWHPQIPEIPVEPAWVAESFQRAKDALFPDDKNIHINRKRLVINCMRELRVRRLKGVDNDEDWGKHLSKIRDSLADDIGLQRWFDKKFRDARADDVNIGWFDLLRQFDKRFFASLSQNSQGFKGFEKGFHERRDGVAQLGKVQDLFLDANEFGIRDVFGAAEFCDKFFSCEMNKIEWHGRGFKPELLIQMKKIRLSTSKILKNIL